MEQVRELDCYYIQNIFQFEGNFSLTLIYELSRKKERKKERKKIMINLIVFTKSAKKRELKNPPIKPSQVLFGDKSISLVFPNILPKMYAKMSFVMTSIAGKINQTKP